MLIDNPEQSREIMAVTGAQPTHPGAESLFTELRASIDDYAAEVERMYAPVWSCYVVEHETPPDADEGRIGESTAWTRRGMVTPSGTLRRVRNGAPAPARGAPFRPFSVPAGRAAMTAEAVGGTEESRRRGPKSP